MAALDEPEAAPAVPAVIGAQPESDAVEAPELDLGERVEHVLCHRSTKRTFSS
jgi:hypothetical protein